MKLKMAEELKEKEREIQILQENKRRTGEMLKAEKEMSKIQRGELAEVINKRDNEIKVLKDQVHLLSQANKGKARKENPNPPRPVAFRREGFF
ncbi:MAG: hypothetical protein P4L31_04815 [Candidatus Babeliales bacterium]|nr:hypothetical protein [Candidatus Babeliales bacterium]